ncbi:uncharacterized protein LOC143463051 isoform X2 [Clavelina lepadiformis]|uniref:uncharacterized protein LOC143463051 isoform X2 n=1 Tax=Clavelina lepadiformis TaxID=159417 RepID=UPI004040F3B4
MIKTFILLFTVYVAVKADGSRWWPNGGNPGNIPRSFPLLRPRQPSLCAQSCQNGNQCPTAEEKQNMMQRVPQECRRCVMETCEESDDEDCIDQAHSDCAQCPVLSEEQQGRRRNCFSCKTTCSGKRRFQKRPFKPFKMFSCFKNCTEPEMCDGLDNIMTRLQMTSAGCKQCVMEECGPFNRNNRSDVADCIQEARSNCDECPTLSDEEQTRKRTCKECVRNCSPYKNQIGGIGSVRRRLVRPHRRIACMSRCKSNGNCPTKMMMMNKLVGVNRDCRRCVMSECDVPGRNDRSEEFDCFEEAFETCSSCPTLTVDEQTKRKMCRTCVQGCFPGQLGISDVDGRRAGPGKFPSSRGPFRRFACMNNCQSEGDCPSRDELMTKMQGMSNGCRGCVMEQCGPFNRNNRSDVADCIQEARRNCDECPTLSDEEQNRMRTCKECVRNCSPNHNGPGIKPIRRFQGLMRKRCHGKCVNNNTCPSMIVGMQRIERLDSTCRRCIMSRCGPPNQDDRDAFMGCLEEAREECSECPTMSDEDQNTKRKCITCVQRCSGMNRPKLPRRIFSRFTCMKSCEQSDVCPSRIEVRNSVMSSRRDCRGCVMQECGEFERSNRSEVLDCLLDARAECSSCPPAGDEEERRMGECRTCISGCFTDDEEPNYPTGSTGNHQRPSGFRPGGFLSGRGPFRRFACMKNCQSEGDCPSRDELMTKMQGMSNSCRGCVMEQCGPFNRNNRSDVADCIEEARSNCDECPTLSDEEQNRMRTCKECVRNCSPNNNGPGFKPIRRFQGLMRKRCHGKCVNNKTCPTLIEGMQRFGRLDSTCRRCIMSRCGPPDQDDRDAFMECLEEAREECSECPTMSDEDQNTKRKCITCVQRCSGMNRPKLPRRIFSRFSCMKSCEQSDVCPSRIEVRNSVMSSRRECRSCVMQECGEFERSNRSEVLDCLVDARAECSSCPPAGEEEERRMGECRTCISGCFTDDEEPSSQTLNPFPPRQKPPGVGPKVVLPDTPDNSFNLSGLSHSPNNQRRPGGYGGNNRAQGRNFGVCRQTCFSSASCRSSAFTSQMPSESVECAQCVANACGHVPVTSQLARATCVRRARLACASCPRLSPAQRSQGMGCQRCLSGCAQQSSSA